MVCDCHIHMVLDGVDWKQAIARHTAAVDETFVHRTLAAWQKAGYTYLRDGGDKWGVGAFARKAASQYGITYRTPLAPLCKQGHYGSFIGLTWDNLQMYAQMVTRHRENGADFIKIMISGLMDFDHYGVLTQPGLEAAEIRALVHIAHSEGMAVMAHANGPRVMEAAAMAGVDSIEHGAYADDDTLAAMADSGTVWVPTLSTIANLSGKGRFSQYAVEKILDSAMENVAQFRGLVALGTDAGAWAVPHACGTEEALLSQCGVDYQAGNRRIRELF